MQETRSIQGGAQVYKNDAGQNIANVPFAQALENQRVNLGLGASWQLADNIELNWDSSLSHYKKQDELTSLI